jgi:hypothetical protein
MAHQRGLNPGEGMWSGQRSALTTTWSEKAREASHALQGPRKETYKRIWAAAKRAKNPESQREANRKYRAAHLELILKKNRELMRARRAASKLPEV